MKRNLNESAQLNEGIKICVSEIRNIDSNMDCNELRDLFVEAGAEVEGSHGLYNDEPATFMTVNGLDQNDVIEILQDFLDNSEESMEASDFITAENVETDFPAYEDVNVEELDPEEQRLNDELNAINEETDIIDEAKAELRELLAKVDTDFDFVDTVVLSNDLEIESISTEGEIISVDGQILNAFDDLTDADDIYALCDAVKDELEFEAEYPAYDDVDVEDEVEPTFEKIHKGHHLEEKKGGCCPGTNNVDEVNESESIDIVLNDLDTPALKESKEAESKKQSLLEAKTIKALSENSYSLHTNISYNGKTFDKMTLKELKSLYETINASVTELSNRLNESVVEDKLIDTINKKKQLLEYIDEEITYRTTRTNCLKKLNEDGAEISDEELANLFGPAQGEDPAPAESSEETPEESTEESSEENKEEEKSDENKDDENSEEVELARIEITLKDTQAAKDLKQACIDAGISEDAIELENVDEDSDAFDDENKEEEKSEETPEEQPEETEEPEENTNESYEFAKYVKMLGEGEVPEETTEEQPVEDTPEETPEESSEDSDENKEEDEEEDKQPKFILTDTDYAFKLAKVLEDIYGISKDEFEEMIGGSIVDQESSDEENKEEKSEENKEESSEENKEESSEDDEEIDPSDLFKNL